MHKVRTRQPERSPYIGGSLGDRFGRRRIFVGGLLAFGVTGGVASGIGIENPRRRAAAVPARATATADECGH